MMFDNLNLVVVATLLLGIVAEVSGNKTVEVKLYQEKINGIGEFGLPLTSYYATINIAGNQVNAALDLDSSGIFVIDDESHSHGAAATDKCEIDFLGQKLVGHKTEAEFELVGPSQLDNETDTTDTKFTSLNQNYVSVRADDNEQLRNLLVSLPTRALIGLGSRTDETLGSIMDRLKSNNLIDVSQMSLRLKSTLTGRDGGVLTFGQFDKSLLDEVKFWHQLDDDVTGWTTGLQFVTYKNKIVSCFNSLGQCRIRFSTLHNGFYGPREDVELIYRLIGSQKHSAGFQVVDCDLKDLPMLIFHSGPMVFAMPPPAYISVFVSRTKGLVCYVDIFPHPNPTNNFEWILGSKFLSGIDVLFDQDVRRVATIPRIKPSPSPPADPPK